MASDRTCNNKINSLSHRFVNHRKFTIILDLKIHFHTFRHCKALKEYHKTKSMQHVKRVLGHKSILTTQRYVDLYEEIYSDLKPDNFICEVASTSKDAKNSLNKVLNLYAKLTENSYSRRSNEKTTKL